MKPNPIDPNYTNKLKGLKVSIEYGKQQLIFKVTRNGVETMRPATGKEHEKLRVLMNVVDFNEPSDFFDWKNVFDLDNLCLHFYNIIEGVEDGS